MNSLISVNVGLPRNVEWQGEVVHTAIWKKPVTGGVMARRLNLDGDGQGDLAGHGGFKAPVRSTPQVVVRASSAWPVKLPLRLFDRQVIDAGVSSVHKAMWVKLPILIAIRTNQFPSSARRTFCTAVS